MRQQIRLDSQVFCKILTKNCIELCRLFSVERVHWIQFRGATCRTESENYSDENRKEKRNEATCRAHSETQRAHIFQCNRYQNSKGNSRDAAHHCDCRGLNQKLTADYVRACAQRFSYADFLATLSNCNNHYVHNSDAANQKRNGCDCSEHHAQ